MTDDAKPNAMFEQGLEIRREVLGREHVDRSLASADEFARPLQLLVTEYAWGAIWGRPQLDRKTRQLKQATLFGASY